MSYEITKPVGNWWGAFDDGSVWPVEVLAVTQFGTRIRATHDAAPQGEQTLPNSHVYDSKFNHPKREWSQS